MKKMKFAAVLILLLSFGLPGMAAKKDSADSKTNAEFFAGDFNVLRVENEAKILIPKDKAEEVWDYLYSKYVDSKDALNGLGNGFTSSSEKELFTDTYFDTPSLDLLKMKNGVRYRRRESLINEDNAKNGRELVQIKIENVTTNEMARGEYKYPVKYTKDGKLRQGKTYLYSLIDENYLNDFEQRVKKLGIDPLKLKPILTVEDVRPRIYIFKDKALNVTISVDNVTSKRLWAKAEFAEIELEVNEIAYTDGSKAEQERLLKLDQTIIDDVMKEFSYAKKDLTPKYNKAFDRLAAQIPFFKFLIKYFL